MTENLRTNFNSAESPETAVIAMGAENALNLAQALLTHGQVIAAPTDTVYGILCRYDCAAAIEQLYVAKGRPPHKAIPVLLADIDQLPLVSPLTFSSLTQRLMDRFWPGALTLIVPARPGLPEILTAGQPTVGVRVPDHDLLRRLIRRTGPLAATSANLSGAPETHTAAAVCAQLQGRIPLVLDDGEFNDERKLMVPSTVVDVTATPPQVLPRRTG